MNHTRLLVASQLRSIRNQLSRGDRAGSIWRLLSALSIVALFWVGTYYFFHGIFVYLHGMPLFGPILATRLLAMVFLIFLFMILFSDIVTALSSLYLAKDLDSLIARPIEMVHIFGHKMVQVLFYGSWVVLCFGLPMFIAYGNTNNAAWSFPALSVVLVIPFLVIPAGVAVFVTMLVARFLPARRVRFLLVCFVIFFGGMTFALFRIIRPEFITSPERIASVEQYLYQLRVADSVYLPSSWLTESFRSAIDSRTADTAFYGLLLLSTAGVVLIGSTWLAAGVYYNGWERARSSQTGTGRGRVRGDCALVPGARAVVLKDIRTFVRDPAQWAQLVLLVSLVVVYLVSNRRLPVDLDEAFWKNLLVFVNMGLTAYILATIALKFVFPSISLEGRNFWIVGGSPLSMRRFVAAKFWGSLLILLIPAELLMFLSGIILKVEPGMAVLAAVTILVLTAGLTAMAVGMGAMMPRFDLDSAAEISSGLGGLLNIIFALLYVAAVIVLIAWPVHLYSGQGLAAALGRPEVRIAAAAFVVINTAAIWLPMRLGLRSLLRKEIV